MITDPKEYIVKPYIEWRKVQDKYDTAEAETGVDLDI
jgi:hypothetical protein